MRIGIDVRCLIEPHHSGVAYYTKNLLEHLFAVDTKNTYLLFYNSYRPVKNTVLEEYKKFSHVSLHSYSWPNKFFNFSQKYFKRPLIDKLLGGVDIFFAPNLQFLALSSDCKKVSTAHDLSFEIYPEFLSLKRKFWHKVINPRKFFSSSDAIIAVSKNTKKDLINIYNIPEDKINVIYSGVETQLIASVPNETQPKYILTISTLEPRKNIESLITAFKRLIKNEQYKDYQLFIVGSKGWKSKSIYKSAANENSIKFLGYVSEEKKQELYMNAQAFVFPSFYEGFGFPPLQALKYNVPVIAAQTSSLPEILGPAALYVNPYDSAELSRALQSVLQNNSLRENLINAGKTQANNFSWEKSARDTLAVFNSLV
ncbi:MAG: glycosyltransferase family 1 protein [Patescibacteria group bacterium]|jgi:glycosyltransferase involved in cell wall biosynthesis